jgi:hypothetical protein
MTTQDKRRFVRVNSENVIAYSVLKDDGSLDMAHSGYVHSKNISLGGILFTAMEVLDKGARLQLKIRIDTEHSKDECVMMVGEVVRNQKIPVGRKWDIAVTIKFIEQSKMEVFSNWLARKIGY